MRSNASADALNLCYLMDTNITSIPYNCAVLLMEPRTALSSTVLDFNYSNIGVCISDADYFINNKTPADQTTTFAPAGTTATAPITGYLNAPFIVVV
jgi:hypothetical protein